MKIKPIITCFALSLNNVTSLEKHGELADKLDAYFAEAVDNGDVNTVWSTGEVCQDTIVLIQDPSGPDGHQFAVDLPDGSMLKITKMLYKTMGLELEAFLLEHRSGDVVTSKWFVYRKPLENFVLVAVTLSSL